VEVGALGVAEPGASSRSVYVNGIWRAMSYSVSTWLLVDSSVVHACTQDWSHRSLSATGERQLTPVLLAGYIRA